MNPNEIVNGIKCNCSLLLSLYDTIFKIFITHLRQNIEFVVRRESYYANGEIRSPYGRLRV